MSSRLVLLRSSESSLGETIANHPVGSLTLAGGALGALWGAGVGFWFGGTGMKIGAALGAAALGLKGYSTGRDLKAWLK
jgi:outer membrane lipoprotein SlyB